MILEALQNSGINLSFEDAKKFTIALLEEIKPAGGYGEVYFDNVIATLIEEAAMEHLP